MIYFKKEIIIIVEGKSSKELSEGELFSKLKITENTWWKNNPNWPYGRPCDGLIDLELKEVKLKELSS